MFGYYIGLAIRSLRRNVVLTVLMIAAIGVGIGASMTTLTIFRAMSGDPLPGKSAQLFVPQIDNWGPQRRGADSTAAGSKLQTQLTYIDAIRLMDAHAAKRQSAMYGTGLPLIPANRELQPFTAPIRASYTDFFPMFEVPFLYGAAWSAADDAAHAAVVVLSRKLNDKLFAGANSVGQSINLDGQTYRIVGVLKDWEPIPKFYDLTDERFGKSADVFMPFTRAIDQQLRGWGSFNCRQPPESGYAGTLRSECIWIQFWVELPTAADVARYRMFLQNYATDQRRSGRFDWTAETALRDLPEWLRFNEVVSDEVRILVLVSFSFLFVCLLNAMGLMLAKIMARAQEIGVRRALGANRRAIFTQCLVESSVIGLAGAALGLALTTLGLLGLRALLSKSASALANLDMLDVGIVIVLALASAILAGLYPTWRAGQVQPAWQLKAQ
jgi:putative ABC transport system permease protein